MTKETKKILKRSTLFSKIRLVYLSLFRYRKGFNDGYNQGIIDVKEDHDFMGGKGDI